MGDASTATTPVRVLVRIDVRCDVVEPEANVPVDVPVEAQKTRMDISGQLAAL